MPSKAARKRTPRSDLYEAIEQWLNDPTSVDLARKLNVSSNWVSEFERVVRYYERSQAGSKVELTATSTTGDVGPDDKVVVLLDGIEIKSLFTDDERLEFGDQEGTVLFTVNEQVTTIGWKRLLKRPTQKKRKWDALKDTETRLLFAGKPKGLVDVDAQVVESDEPERQFFEKITALLTTAATFAGFVPVYGTAASAGLALGAAVADLIKAKIDDDAELQCLASIGGDTLPLRYGKYALIRHSQGGATPEIVMKLRVDKLDPTSMPKGATILLDAINFSDNGDESIRDLVPEDRLKAEITITRTPEKSDEGADAGPPITTLKIDRPYFGENAADWNKTLGIADKLLFDGIWGRNIAFTINLSGIPREIHHEEWMAIIQKTGALISSVTPPEQQASVHRGFTIAETASATVAKLLPKTRFVASASSMLLVGAPLSGLYVLQNNQNWQVVRVPMKLGRYGNVEFKMKVRLRF